MGRKKSTDKIKKEAESSVNTILRHIDRLIDLTKAHEEFWTIDRRTQVLSTLQADMLNLVNTFDNVDKPEEPFKL